MKYVDKKKDWEVPDSVLKLLESFINTDEYNTCSVVDEVTLNILASKLGAKSVMEYSLKSLEKNYPVSGQDLVFVTMTIMLSSKVDDGLKEWLKKQLKYDMRYEHLGNNTHWQIATGKHPEVITRVMELLGLIEKQENEIFRIL